MVYIFITNRFRRMFMRSFGEEIQKLEDSFFVGRKTELELFRNFILTEENNKRILNVCGTGGIGKSTLLDQFRRVSEQNGVPFFCVDS